MSLSMNNKGDSSKARVAIGAAIMIVAATAGLVAVIRLRVNATDEAADGRAAGPGVFGLGERVIAFVRRSPFIACAAVACVAAGSAMTHAETTVTGALPWGLAQAAAVVIGFLVLGPTLELHRI